MSKKFNPSCGDIYDVHKEMKADSYSAYHCQHELGCCNVFALGQSYLKLSGKAPLEVVLCTDKLVLTSE